MTRPTVSEAQAWQPDSLREAADSWDRAATDVHAKVDIVVRGVEASRDFWTGSAADAAREQAGELAVRSDGLARALLMAAVAARDGADQIAEARRDVLDIVDAARRDGYAVADDGTVTPADPVPLLVALSGGDAGLARDMMRPRAVELTRHIAEKLDALGAADVDAAHDIDEAFASAPDAAGQTRPAGAAPSTEPVAAWPSMSQDRIAAAISAMTPEQRQRLIEQFPKQVGNTDGVPWEMRITANRINIAEAILDERRGTNRPDVIAFYQRLLGEVLEPARHRGRIDRQILAFDPDRALFAELIGDLSSAKGVGVLVPGLNTTVEDSAAYTSKALRFVTASSGDVAMITYLGGPFPRGWGPAGIIDAADPRYALEMAPRLVAFSEDVDRTVDATGRSIPVTYVGHSYGGSILGTAERMGLTADRTLYLESAGAGVGVDDPGDWHNRNPNVLRFSMTAPGDPIEAVQGIPFDPHGADTDEMPGVIRLDTGHYRHGRLMMGPSAHTDVLSEPSDAWDNILGVITGGRMTLYEDPLFAWAG